MCLAEAKNDQKWGFLDFLITYSCPSDPKVVYSDSTHWDLSFGTKIKSLWPCGGILWPNLGQKIDAKRDKDGSFQSF